jgi:hypothetical protein
MIVLGLMVVWFSSTAAAATYVASGPQRPSEDAVSLMDGSAHKESAIAATGPTVSLLTSLISRSTSDAFALQQGLQYAIEAHRGGFMVTDGHHNRVPYVDLNGTVSVAYFLPQG